MLNKNSYIIYEFLDHIGSCSLKARFRKNKDFATMTYVLDEVFMYTGEATLHNMQPSKNNFEFVSTHTLT